jgi:hypothetical protein
MYDRTYSSVAQQSGWTRQSQRDPVSQQHWQQAWPPTSLTHARQNYAVRTLNVPPSALQYQQHMGVLPHRRPNSSDNLRQIWHQQGRLATPGHLHANWRNLPETVEPMENTPFLPSPLIRRQGNPTIYRNLLYVSLLCDLVCMAALFGAIIGAGYTILGAMHNVVLFTVLRIVLFARITFYPIYPPGRWFDMSVVGSLVIAIVLIFKICCKSLPVETHGPAYAFYIATTIFTLLHTGIYLTARRRYPSYWLSQHTRRIPQWPTNRVDRSTENMTSTGESRHPTYGSMSDEQQGTGAVGVPIASVATQVAQLAESRRRLAASAPMPIPKTPSSGGQSVSRGRDHSGMGTQHRLERDEKNTSRFNDASHHESRPASLIIEEGGDFAFSSSSSSLHRSFVSRPQNNVEDWDNSAPFSPILDQVMSSRGSMRHSLESGSMSRHTTSIEDGLGEPMMRRLMSEKTLSTIVEQDSTIVHLQRSSHILYTAGETDATLETHTSTELKSSPAVDVSRQTHAQATHTTEQLTLSADAISAPDMPTDQVTCHPFRPTEPLLSLVNQSLSQQQTEDKDPISPDRETVSDLLIGSLVPPGFVDIARATRKTIAMSEQPITAHDALTMGEPTSNSFFRNAYDTPLNSVPSSKFRSPIQDNISGMIEQFASPEYEQQKSSMQPLPSLPSQAFGERMGTLLSDQVQTKDAEQPLTLIQHKYRTTIDAIFQRPRADTDGSAMQDMLDLVQSKTIRPCPTTHQPDEIKHFSVPVAPKELIMALDIERVSR